MYLCNDSGYHTLMVVLSCSIVMPHYRYELASFPGSGLAGMKPGNEGSSHIFLLRHCPHITIALSVRRCQLIKYHHQTLQVVHAHRQRCRLVKVSVLAEV